MKKSSKVIIGNYFECDHSEYDGNNILVEGVDIDYIFISMFEFIKFSTEEQIIDFVSFMSNNITPILQLLEKLHIFNI